MDKTIPIKKFVPSKIKDLAKKLLDIVDRRIIPASKPFVLENKFGVRFIYYPWEKNAIRVLLERNDLKKEILIAKKLIKSGNIVFDVGSNIGILSVLYSKFTGYSGKVYSLEPVNSTFERLKENLALNRCENVIPLQIALSNATGSAKMRVFDDSASGINSLGEPKYPEYKTNYELVKTDILDNFCDQLKIEHIDFLKIDVEGFEKNVLEGSDVLLKKNLIKFIQFEISDIPLKGAGRTPEEILYLLEKYNYSVFSFNQKTNKFVGPISILRIGKGKYDNFYASQQDLSKI